MYAIYSTIYIYTYIYIDELRCFIVSSNTVVVL